MLWAEAVEFFEGKRVNQPCRIGLLTNREMCSHYYLLYLCWFWCLSTSRLLLPVLRSEIEGLNSQIPILQLNTQEVLMERLSPYCPFISTLSTYFEFQHREWHITHHSHISIYPATPLSKLTYGKVVVENKVPILQHEEV